MTGNIHGSIGGTRWLKWAAMGAVGVGMLGITACGSSSGGAYYNDGYYGGTGGVYYSDSYRPNRHYNRYHRDYDGYRDRGYYDRNGYWRRY